MISELRKFQTYEHPCFPESPVTLRFYCTQNKYVRLNRYSSMLSSFRCLKKDSMRLVSNCKIFNCIMENIGRIGHDNKITN